MQQNPFGTGATDAFSYGNKPATLAGQAALEIQSSGFFNDWFFNMFAAMLDIVHAPLLILAYLLALAVLVVLRAYFENPVKFCGEGIVYGYSIIQSFTLFKKSHYVVSFTPTGWELTFKSLWFAALFTGLMVWGLSRVLEYLYTTAITVGLGQMLAPLMPAKLLDKFRSSDKEIEALEEGGTAKNPKKQNTAIMMTDIVGYSKQMGANEAAMFAKLQVHNEIMRNQIVRNRGTVIKTIGDAFMVRFRSAESAVMCALDCQKAIKEYNKTKTPEDQFHVRIGVHMGEVIHTGSDVFGEGVNIAARIEPKCDPDGVCVSDVIANAARNKVPAHFSSIGRQPMKNIANPPELFKVFAIEEQAGAKVAKAGPAGAAAGAGGNPGGVFKI
jgi:class 3 adenylate cyclase